MDGKELMELAVAQIKTSMEQSQESLQAWEKKLPCSVCGADRPARQPGSDYDWALCESCGIKRYWNDREQFEAAIPKRVNDRMEVDGFPKKLLNMDFILPEKFKDRFSTERGLFLWGPPGTGKTTTLALMVRDHYSALFKKAAWRIPNSFPFKSVLFENVPSLMLRLQSMFKKEGGDPNERIIELAESDLLILDDLGAEKQTEWVKQTLYVLINEREMNLRPTYLTSNKSLDDLNQEIDPRIASRIAGMCDVVKMAGMDRRLDPKRPG